MADYDLTARMVAHMDRHLALPLLEFLQEHKVYDDAQILQGKISLLSGTKIFYSNLTAFGRLAIF